jgi:hypothetical protein
MSLLRRTLLVCTVLLLSACSSTTFVYNRLDFILPWYLDDYAELDREQEKYLDGLLSPFLAWHRSVELPRYVKVLEDIEVSLDQPLTADVVAAISIEFENAWFRLEGEALDWLLDLGAKLSDEQIQGFLAELQEQQQEYEEKYLTRSDEEFHEESYDNLQDTMQDYLGRLNRAQRDLLRDTGNGLLRSDRTWLSERAAWLEKLTVLLEREPGWQQRVREAIAARNENVSPEYLRIYEHNLRLIHSAIAELLNSRTEKQDRRLRRKLSELREDLETLIAQGKATAAAKAA